MMHEVPENTFKLYRIFKAAVEDERKAQQMYQDALALCEDPMVRAAIEGLYADEVRHEWEVIGRYNDLRKQYAALAADKDPI